MSDAFTRVVRFGVQDDVDVERHALILANDVLKVREVLGSETCDGNQHAERTAVARPCGSNQLS
jgi:hypothetical protein